MLKLVDGILKLFVQYETICNHNDAVEYNLVIFVVQVRQVMRQPRNRVRFSASRTAPNQTEYQKRYDSLVQRFDQAKTRLEEVTAEIQEKQTASANMGAFLSAFEQMPDALTEFTLESWHSMVDFATVYSIDDIRFTFKNGQEIQA